MDEEITLNLAELYEIIKKRVKLIIVIVVLAVAVSAVLSYYVIPPTYEAQTSIIVGKPMDQTQRTTSQYNDVLMYQNLVKTYTEIAKSKLIAQEASEKLGRVLSADAIQSSITITPQQGTQILMIKTENKDSKLAADLVNSVADSFVDQAKKLYPTGGDIQIIDKAEIPKGPVKPKKMLNIAVAFFISLMASMGIVFLLEYMDSTIKTESDIERFLELPVLGIIPKQAD